MELCLEKGILVELMEKHGKSIIDILHFEITQEEAMDWNLIFDNVMNTASKNHTRSGIFCVLKIGQGPGVE